MIEIGSEVNMNRWKETYTLTKAGSIPDPIDVNIGTRGTPISQVGFTLER